MKLRRLALLPLAVASGWTVVGVALVTLGLGPIRPKKDAP